MAEGKAVITIHEITKAGTGTRVCIDMADSLSPTEGLLIGSTGSGYFHVLSENNTTDTYPPRVFRVNTGGIHHYIRETENTVYASEIQGGHSLDVFDGSEWTRKIVGRAKWEHRDLLHVSGFIGKKKVTAVLQQSDSVCLMSESGERAAVIDLKPGDKVQGFADIPGRHLGKQIEEYIEEK